MQISILDFGGNFVGPALGLAVLGHEVRAFVAGGSAVLEAAGLLAPEPEFDAELVVVAASFADECWAEHAGIQRDARYDPEDPLLPTIHPLQRHVRNRWLLERIGRARRAVVVDLSDCGEIVDPCFLALAPLRFKREVPFWLPAGDVAPFPYLYHPSLLAIEAAGGLDALRLPVDERGHDRRVVFAGTLDHWRYCGRRRALLERFVRAHPHEEVVILGGEATLVETWTHLQRSRAALYLPGRGEICFRLHEIVALGVPAIAPEPFTIAVPPAWQRAIASDPDDPRAGLHQLRFYRDHYHYVHAARYLLARIGATRGPRRGSPALRFAAPPEAERPERGAGGRARVRSRAGSAPCTR